MIWFTGLLLSYHLFSLSPSFGVSSFQVANQEQNYNDDIWKILLKVKSIMKDNAYMPQFTPEAKALDGKIITIKGYMYPLEEAPKHEFFMLSYFPTSVCFFCGGAGPESIIEVTAAKPVVFSSRPVTLRGKLKLNQHDKERLFFLLLSAEEVK